MREPPIARRRQKKNWAWAPKFLKLLQICFNFWERSPQLEGGRTLVFGVRVRFAFACGTVRIWFGFACGTVRVRLPYCSGSVRVRLANCSRSVRVRSYIIFLLRFLSVRTQSYSAILTTRIESS